MLVKTDIPKLLEAGIRREFMKEFERKEAEWEKIAIRINSTKDTENYAWLGSVGDLHEWKDERIPEALYEHSYSIKNLDWEASIAISRNAIEDENSSSLNSVNSEKPSLGGNSEPSSRDDPSLEKVQRLCGDYTKEELIYGLLMGDGYLSPVKNSQNSRFFFAQSLKHREYVDFVRSLVEKFWKTKTFVRRVRCGFNSKTYIQYGFRTKVHPFFTHLRKKVFYPYGRKRINQRILSKITPLGLALWYMDDGTLRYQKSRRGQKRTLKGDRKFLLCTGGYTLKENRLIQDWFQKKWGIRWKIRYFRYHQPYLIAGVKEGLKFIKLIKPFIIPSMYYKIDLKYQMLNKSPLKAEILRVYPEYKI